jgi:molybdate transport system ATP-binding protein
MNSSTGSGGFDIAVALERAAVDCPAFRLDASLQTGPGITVLFGTSGAGKSTLIQAVLGALRPARGHIVVAGRTLFDAGRRLHLPVHMRRVGIVFQDALLFPHLSARDNVAFGLTGPDRRSRADALLGRVGAESLAARMPAELSGGERQRVALARALAAEPAALLLDEPFSALDAAAREGLGTLLIDLQRSSGVPFLHVTHDIGEALRLGHTLVVMDEGRIVQSGAPADVTCRPTSAAAARAVGTENLFTGTVRRNLPERGYSEVDLGGTVVETGLLPLPDGSRVALGLRAEDVLLASSAIGGTSARNVIEGRVEEVHERAAGVELRIATPVPFRVIVTHAARRELALARGTGIFLLVKANAFQRLI